MTALEQLPDRFDRLERGIDRLAGELRGDIRTAHVMIVTSLTEQLEDSRRQTRVLFEEMQSRLAVIQEGGRRTRAKRG